MKKVLTILMILWVINLHAQPTYDIDLNQTIGNEWGFASPILESVDDFPIPEGGANQVWDYSYLANELSSAGVLFSELSSIDDYNTRRRFVDPSTIPVSIDGEASLSDSIPRTIGCLLSDSIIIGSGTNISITISPLGYALGNDDGELVNLGFLRFENGFFKIQRPFINSELIVPSFPDQFGESLVTTDTTVSFIFTENFNAVDTNTTITSISYIGYGTLKMHFGDVEDVILLKETERVISAYYDTDTGEFVGDFVFNADRYLFVQNENLVPLITYTSRLDRDELPLEDIPSVSINQQFLGVDVLNSTSAQAPISLSVELSPNPVRDQAFVSFNLDQPSDINLDILSVDGKFIYQKSLGNLGAGLQSDSFILPDNISTGLYILKVNSSAGRSGVTKFLVD